MQVDTDRFEQGLKLLQQPALPLVTMVQFLFLTGDFSTVAEVIEEMPQPIETGYTRYDEPRQLLRGHLPHLLVLEALKAGDTSGPRVVDEAGNQLDPMSAVTAMISQQVMEQELEAVNSALCAPCNCTLCCVGPETCMEQHFFEIPLQDGEQDSFSLPRHDTAQSRQARAMDAEPLQLENIPFYACSQPALVHWQTGWSMILPRGTSCPALGKDNRCRIYDNRPRVCRKPQIFSYVLEPTEDIDVFCQRNTLLAVTDCPYVQQLSNEVAAYAAACELQFVVQGNKQ